MDLDSSGAFSLNTLLLDTRHCTWMREQGRGDDDTRVHLSQHIRQRGRQHAVCVRLIDGRHANRERVAARRLRDVRVIRDTVRCTVTYRAFSYFW